MYFIIVSFNLSFFRRITIEINPNPKFLAVQEDIFVSNISPSLWLSFFVTASKIRFSIQSCYSEMSSKLEGKQPFAIPR